MAHSGTYLTAHATEPTLSKRRNDHSLYFRRLFARILSTTAALGALGMLAAAFPVAAKSQEPNPTEQANPITEQNGIYIYRVKVVQAQPGLRELSPPKRLHHDRL